MSALVLQLIAYGSMLVDHIGILGMSAVPSGTALFWVFYACRMIGRLAFPLFAFGIAEGYRHTRDLPRYTLRLLGLAIVSQIPFALFRLAYHGFSLDRLVPDASGWLAWAKLFTQMPNICFTLLFGLIAVFVWEAICSALRTQEKVSARSRAFHLLCAVLSVAAIAWLAERFRFEYGWRGVLLIVGLHLCARKPLRLGIVLSVYCISWLSAEWFYLCPLLAFLPLLLYSGARGRKTRVLYAFYPLHLILLILLARILMGQA